MTRISTGVNNSGHHAPYRQGSMHINSDRPSKLKRTHHEPRTNKNAQYAYATSQNLRIHCKHDPYTEYDTYDFKKVTYNQEFVIKRPVLQIPGCPRDGGQNLNHLACANCAQGRKSQQNHHGNRQSRPSDSGKARAKTHDRADANQQCLLKSRAIIEYDWFRIVFRIESINAREYNNRRQNQRESVRIDFCICPGAEKSKDCRSNAQRYSNAPVDTSTSLK